MDLLPTEAAAVAGCPLVFSALDAAVAGPIEAELAAAGHLVVTNAGSHRMDADVPLVVPEVNPGHLAVAADADRAAVAGRSSPTPTARPSAWSSPSSRSPTPSVSSGCT